MSSALYGVWIIGVFLVVVWSMRAERDPQARFRGLLGLAREGPSASNAASTETEARTSASPPAGRKRKSERRGAQKGV